MLSAHSSFNEEISASIAAKCWEAHFNIHCLFRHSWEIQLGVERPEKPRICPEYFALGICRKFCQKIGKSWIFFQVWCASRKSGKKYFFRSFFKESLEGVKFRDLDFFPWEIFFIRNADSTILVVHLVLNLSRAVIFRLYWLAVGQELVRLASFHTIFFFFF